MHHVPRFPRRHELYHVIRSGNVFVYTEIVTGTRDWVDGKDWVLVRHGNGLRMERERGSTGPYTLMKMSGSISVRGVRHDIVSYYKLGDILEETLERPSQNSNLRRVPLHPDLAVLVPRPHVKCLENIEKESNSRLQKLLRGGKDKWKSKRKPQGWS